MKNIALKKYFYVAALICGMLISHHLARLSIFPRISEQGVIEVTFFFNLVEVWNTGISFGLMRNMAYSQWILSGIASVILLVMGWFLRSADKTTSVIGLGFIIAGGFGNIIDRVRFGAVADYLDFHVYGYHWPAFNLTDIAIFIGVALFVAGEMNVFSSLASPKIKQEASHGN